MKPKGVFRTPDRSVGREVQRQIERRLSQAFSLKSDTTLM